MQSVLEDLRALETDPDVERLQKSSACLSLPRMFGIQRSELMHSDVLATLFDPQQHHGAEQLLRSLLERIAGRDDSGTSGDIETILAEAWDSIRVYREWHHIDIVVFVCLEKRSEEYVIAIENKVDAALRRGQLPDYQKRLSRHFRRGILLFLTPKGRQPEQPASPEFPWAVSSYGDIAGAIESIIRYPIDSDSRDQIVLWEIARHLKEEIMGSRKAEETAQVRTLWERFPQAMRAIVRHRPRLEDHLDDYESALKRRLAHLKPRFGRYPAKRGKARESKMILGAWEESFPITFMLHARRKLPRRSSIVRLR